jgi:hypothetical protein
MPRGKRSWLAVGALTLAATAGLVTMAAPASAHTGTINGAATCGSDGTYTVIWSGVTSNVPASGSGHTATLAVETSTSSPTTSRTSRRRAPCRR